MKKINITILISMSIVAQSAWSTCASPEPNIQPSRPDTRYTDNYDGTVTDDATGLTWSKCSIGQTWIDNSPDDGSDDACNGTASGYNWGGALNVARIAGEGGYLGLQGWRLPNVKELGSLMENACKSPAINQSIFPSTANANYWSSSPYLPGTGHDAWYVGFQSRGEIYRELKSQLYHVRLVREGN